jgi:hypothetical protein
VKREEPETLALRYALEGDLARLRIPAPRRPRIGDKLWQHTCFEVFIARSELPGYHEFNFAPSREWAAYLFSGYRQGAAVGDSALGPVLSVRSSLHRLELDAVIRLDRLSPLHPAAKLTLALAAVVEEDDGALSYWALRHPAGEPDFHHREAFALELDAVRD